MAGLRDGGVGTKGRREFTQVGEPTVASDAEELLVVLELPTPSDLVQVFGCPMGFSVGSIGGVTRSHWRKSGVGMVQVLDDLVPSHCGHEFQVGGVRLTFDDGRWTRFGRVVGRSDLSPIGS